MAETAQEPRPDSGGEGPLEDTDTPPKKSKFKELWGKLGLDLGTVIMMFKGSLPPTIGVAIYQSPAVAAYFGTLGYLVAIISVISLCIMPRAKYLQTIILNTIGICFGSAIALLGIWSGVQARLHTQGSVPAAYNSSQAAVCAIWLFANIYFANVMRAKFPAFQLTIIHYSILTDVAFTYGPLFTTIEQGESLVRELLTGFLSAYGIATGVSLFIFPVTSRTVVFKEMAGYFGALRGTLKAQSAYLQSLESSDMFSSGARPDSDGAEKEGKKAKVELSQESKALKGAVSGLTGLHGKLHGDIAFGKRDFAWGKLTPDDFDQLFLLFQNILIPLVGMSTITDIFERIAERRGWLEQESETPNSTNDSKLDEKRLWNKVMKQLHEPFAIVTQAMDEGLLHAGILLEILPRPKAKKATKFSSEADIEAKAGNLDPGDIGFAEVLKDKLTDFYIKRGETVKTWAREKGVSAEQFDAARVPSKDDTKESPRSSEHQSDQQQLYLILYMEHLLFSTGMAVGKLVAFSEKKLNDGEMKKNRLILPGKRRIKKWFMSIGKEDSTLSEGTPDFSESGQSTVYMGAGFGGRKDPEHLPPSTAWQHFGNYIRKIPHFLGSVESVFGFRVACATLTVGIVAFLKDTQTFFVEQRLVWAMIIIAIGMTVTTGQSIFGFLARVAGTTAAAVLSIVIWYIVDQKVPGVIVMLWFFIFLEMYFFLKFPRFLPLWLVCMVTQVLIVAYELQVGVIGVTAATASGQPYYPIYELAPYRLACVAGGSFVAFIWTIFPYPLTDRSWLRKDLGSTIYLLANYYSVVHSTISARLHRNEGDMDDKQSPGKQLEKIRRQIFGKLMLLLPSLQQHAEWQKWELNIGGKFPQASYVGIIQGLTNLTRYLSLVVHATQTWQADLPTKKPDQDRVWLDDVARLIDSIDPTSHGITSVLILLSGSVSGGTALPPYIQLPPPFSLSQRLEALDPGILDSRHIEEPGYSAYAVMQVTSSLITGEIKRLVEHVKDLVGETDFSFRLNDESQDSSIASVEKIAGASNGKNKQA